MLDELAEIIAIQINVVLKGSSSVCFKMRTWDSETAGESGKQQKGRNYVELLAEEMWIQRKFGFKKNGKTTEYVIEDAASRCWEDRRYEKVLDELLQLMAWLY